MYQEICSKKIHYSLQIVHGIYYNYVSDISINIQLLQSICVKWGKRTSEHFSILME